MPTPDEMLGPVNEAAPEGFLAVEAACVHHCLDDRGVPRKDCNGKAYSLWGRVCIFKDFRGTAPTEDE